MFGGRRSGGLHRPTRRSTSSRRGILSDFWGKGLSSGRDEEIIEQLTPRDGDICVTKWRYSGFQRTDLRQLLAHHGRDQLIIVGVYAHMGCMISATDAFMSDVAPFFVVDAMGDFSRDEHRMAAEYIGKRAGRVVRAAQVLRAVQVAATEHASDGVGTDRSGHGVTGGSTAGPAGPAGEVALVTGAAGGIGSAVVDALRAAGATVIGWDRQPDTDIRAVDVTDRDAVRAAWDELDTEHGPIGVVVAAAGVMSDDWDTCMAVNAGGVRNLLDVALPSMTARRRGSAVVVSSNAATVPRTALPAYAASKAAATSYARSLGLAAAPPAYASTSSPPGPPTPPCSGVCGPPMPIATRCSSATPPASGWAYRSAGSPTRPTSPRPSSSSPRMRRATSRCTTCGSTEVRRWTCDPVATGNAAPDDTSPAEIPTPPTQLIGFS